MTDPTTLTNPTTPQHSSLPPARPGAILEGMKRAFQFVAAVALLGGFAASARADELKLKDGTRLVGTIVGFDDNSFKVKTSYGFAIVQKDQVISISISDAAKKPEPEKKPEPAAAKSPAPAKSTNADAASKAPAAAPETKLEAPPAMPKTSDAPAAKAATNSVPATPAPVNPANGANAVNAKNSAPPPAPAAPPTPPPPAPMKESVSGNTYTNETYGFHMYKPPDWQVIEGARGVLPGAITAMGTSDQRTYLLIGQEPAGKSLASDVDATEQRMRDLLDNYRPLGEKHITVSGVSAVEHLFRGSVDRHDWSGVIVFLPRDARLFTIFGMTYADNDLVQIQENVIARAIASLQFTKQ
jgi:hypothetical protein